MRRSTYVTRIVVAAVVAASAVGVAIVAAEVERPSVEEMSALRAEVHAAAFNPQALVGVGSCAASGCHGGAKPMPGTEYDNAAWRSSYVVWATSDPHARAYQTLTKPEAAAIVRKLDRVAADKPVSPELDRRCTTCHATANPSEPGLASFAADGIGCESCHGSAKQWLGEHFLASKIGPGDEFAEAQAEKLRLAKLGMLNTDSLTVQAQTCVRCHVGDRSGADGVRDMNHDMIAAGHPALNFEFAAYKRRMPRHWSLPKTNAERSDREAYSYSIGNSVTETAMIKLMADRAEASLDPKPNQPHIPWPEFSEYACYRCHHALRSGSTEAATAQQEFALDRKKWNPSVPFGKQLWDENGFDPFMSEAKLREHIANLRQFVAADDARTLINVREGREGSASSIGEEYSNLLTSAIYRRLSWERATRVYLGCVAMYRAQRAADGKPLDKADDEAGAILKELYHALRFDKPGERRFNSPADYDPVAIKALFQKLAEMQGIKVVRGAK